MTLTNAMGVLTVGLIIPFGAGTAHGAGTASGEPSLQVGCSRSGSVVTCRYTDQGEAAFTVPAGVTSVDVTATGGRGAGQGGGIGATVSGTLGVTPGQPLYAEVNVGGGDGAYPGGGASTIQTCRAGASGCDLTGDPATDPRLVVAAGGGGTGGNGSARDAAGVGGAGGAASTAGEKGENAEFEAFMEVAENDFFIAVAGVTGGEGGGAATITAGGGGGTQGVHRQLTAFGADRSSAEAYGGLPGGKGAASTGGTGGAPVTSDPPVSGGGGGGGGGGGFFGGGGGGSGGAADVTAWHGSTTISSQVGGGGGGGGGGSSLIPTGGAAIPAAAGTVPTVTISYFSYAFAGFQSPVSTGTDDINLIKAGQTVPVKFSLGADYGLNILDHAPTVSAHTCGTDLSPSDLTVDTNSTSGLSYDSTTDTYTYGWKTAKTARGCATLAIHLNDGTTHTADFQYK
ncbi:PxKF domain-containing protein [Streptomyces sp. NPDC126514]|uniref:PxKF domain-containing protein n=1 Tax=Streptomyces sp. NPDC126514 TaxID=3155210 RepID=UPI00332881B8